VSRAAYRVGQAIGAVILFGLLAGYFLVGELRHMTADLHDHNLAVWIYGNDAAPGDHVKGRVWLDEDKANIHSVHVYHWTSTENVDLFGSTFGDDSHPSDTLDFDFLVPANAAPDSDLTLEIDVRSTADESRVRYDLPIYRKTTALLRRIGKAALAVGYFAALAALYLLLRRLYVRRGKEPSAIYVVPAVLGGIVVFVPLVEQVTRVHRWWFAILALAVSASAFWLAEWFNRRVGLVRYRVEPLADAPVKPVEDLENAWLAAGLALRRSGKDLVITKRPEFAIVPVPSSDSFGAASLTFRSSDPDLARELIHVAETILGELRAFDQARGDGPGVTA
jgi:hypothetical protein